jgi:multidrug efflux pump subunit AcrB
MWARAIAEQNAQFAAGKIGQTPSGGRSSLVYTITTRGRMSEVKEFEDIIVAGGARAGPQSV